VVRFINGVKIWGTNFGVMLFKDSITKENLLKYYVKYETNALYKERC